MILGKVFSRNGVAIRLTEERWEHILDNHSDLFDYADYELTLETVADPEYVLRGGAGAMVAVTPFGRRGFLNVLYREVSRTDGFIITAYTTSTVDRRRIVWRKN